MRSMWLNITLDELDQLFNQAGQCIVSHCCFCNGEASFLLTRTSEMSDPCGNGAADRTYSDPCGNAEGDRVCLSCAKRWKPDDEQIAQYEAQAIQLEIEALTVCNGGAS